MADTVKYSLVFLLFSYCLQSFAIPVFDVAQLDPAKSQTLESYFRYIQPGTRNLTPEQALKIGPWLNNQEQSADNFAGPTWVKLKLNNSGPKTLQLALVQSNPQIYDFTLWQKSQSSQPYQKLYTLGLKYPFSQRPIEHRLFVMPITIEAGQSLQLMINANVAGYDLIKKTQLWHQTQFLQKENINAFWQVFYFGAVFVMVLYNLVIYLLTRETSYLLYSAFVSSALGMFFILSNWPFQYFWPNMPAITNPLVYFFMATMLTFAGLFTISFLNLKQRYPLLSKAIQFFCLAIIIEYILYLLLPFDETYTLIRAIMATSVPLYLLNLSAGILVWQKFRVIEASIYVIAWSLLIVVTIAALIHEIWLPFIPIPVISAVQAAHLFEVILLSMALATRINRLKRQEHIAEAKAATQTQFLARMSHEIRTPMNGIVAIADLLKQKPETQQNDHYIEIINTSAKALSLIVNDVLDYSKISAGKLQLRPKACDIRQLLADATMLFELPSQQKNLQLSHQVEDNVPQIIAIDDDRLRQILINLLSNAVKYTQQGFVALSLEQQDKTLTFKISDSGCGIAKVDYQKVFGAFEQGVNNNLARESSTGLGLAICKELVTLMQGDIGFQSNNKGSTFWFTLPLNNSEPLKLAPPKTSKPENKQPIAIRKVLVAEDNIISQKVIEQLFKHLGIDYHLSENGQQALEYYQQHAADIDAVLMDCEMPIMDGFTASANIRQFEHSHNLSETPIIALTAHTLHQQLQHCYEVGMDQLLVKPITLDILRDTLQNLADITHKT